MDGAERGAGPNGAGPRRVEERRRRFFLLLCASIAQPSPEHAQKACSTWEGACRERETHVVERRRRAETQFLWAYAECFCVPDPLELGGSILFACCKCLKGFSGLYKPPTPRPAAFQFL